MKGAGISDLTLCQESSLGDDADAAGYMVMIDLEM